jgi:hypothetical protein
MDFLRGFGLLDLCPNIEIAKARITGMIVRAMNAAIRQLAHDHPQTNPEIRNHQNSVKPGFDEYGKYPSPPSGSGRVLSTMLLQKVAIFWLRASEVIRDQLPQSDDVLLEGGPEF